MSNDSTITDSFINWLKNNKVLGYVIAVGVIIVFLAQVSGGIQYFCGIFSSKSSPSSLGTSGHIEQPQSDEYRLVEVSFHNWLDDFDHESIRGYDRMVAEAAQRGIALSSGENCRLFINYCEERRRIKDNKIDSFLVAYSVAGGDTLSLKYSRKLGINVKGKLYQIFKDDDMRRYIDRHRLDTL